MRTLLILICLTLACGADNRWENLRARNSGTLFPVEEMDSLLTAEKALPAGQRIGLWARRFAEADSSTYLFGLAEGGYVSEGLLISDRVQDCVSLVYRVCELAQSDNHEEALRLALATRFADAALAEVAGEDGRLDYDHPSHLDFSLDMIRSGHWGRDLTDSFPGARLDIDGTLRYLAGTFHYIPEAELDGVGFREGDIAWLVLSIDHEAAWRLRVEHGLAIGHMGVIILEDGEPWLIHAASSPLEGCYEGGRVVKVRLGEYMMRVERYGGLIVTRLP